MKLFLDLVRIGRDKSQARYHTCIEVICKRQLIIKNKQYDIFFI